MLKAYCQALFVFCGRSSSANGSLRASLDRLAMADHDDLDDLLDSALDDFRNVDGIQKSSETTSFRQETPLATSNATLTPSSLGGSGNTTIGQGLGVGLPALGTGKRKTGPTKGKSSAGSGVAPSSSQAGTAAGRVPTNDGHLSDTLDELAKQTRQTLEGLDVNDDAMGDKLVENLVKQFEELGGSQDMQSIMDTMMRQLLSKDVLHEPMKEIGERYPVWLEDNKLKLSNDDYSRYSRQYELIKQLCKVYETNPDDFQKIVDIMQNMQECGQPPSDIVQELAPGMELGADGLPILSELLQDGGPDAGQNCSIM